MIRTNLPWEFDKTATRDWGGGGGGGGEICVWLALSLAYNGQLSPLHTMASSRPILHTPGIVSPSLKTILMVALSLLASVTPIGEHLGDAFSKLLSGHLFPSMLEWVKQTTIQACIMKLKTPSIVEARWLSLSPGRWLQTRDRTLDWTVDWNMDSVLVFKLLAVVTSQDWTG